MCKRLLPLIPAGLNVIQVLPDPARITILAQPRSRTAACVSCGQPSWQVHSTYQRCLCDLPWQGRIVQICVRVRRFRCLNPCWQGRARFFSLMIERDLFGTIRLVRNWGAIGSKGQERVDIYPEEAEAARALESWADSQRQKGYADL